MRLDRIADNVYALLSDLYAQVTSTVVVTDRGAIVIDAMPFPVEAREVAAFVERELGPGQVRYLINTHHHADHVYGSYLFEEAEVVAHDLCRDLLERVGRPSLERAKKTTVDLAEVEIRLPDMTFTEEMYIHLGGNDLRLFHTPGHSPDGISVYVEGEKLLVAGDAVMPVPHLPRGDLEQLRATLHQFKELNPSFIVQGHGGVLLRGEVGETIDGNLAYLGAIVDRVGEIVAQGKPPEELREIDIESCGMSRIPLDGLVANLHLDNLVFLYKQFMQEREG